MRKALITLAVVIYCATNLMAEPVSPSAARQAAARFLQAKGVAVVNNDPVKVGHRAMGEPADDGETSEIVPYYIFNATDRKGFVIVSGDDCVGDDLVLGYTDCGSFEAEAVPSNMQWWLDAMASRIAEMSRRGMKARALALHDDVPYLIKTLWSQGEPIYNPQNPYNALCPVIDGQLCVTGCTATALAQIFNYHRWPQEPINGELRAYPQSDGSIIEALPSTTFDWDNMVDDYLQPTTEAQQMAVATLMRYCGQLMSLKYSPNQTDGIHSDTDILVNQFGYAPGVYEAHSSDYTVSGWDKLIYKEIQEGRPVYYTGQSNSGGHAFIVDGYEVHDGSGYYHLNWGWGGRANGFYKLSLLNPDITGQGRTTFKTAYDHRQFALIGLQPASQSSDYYRYLNCEYWDFNDYGLSHAFLAINLSYRPGTFSIALAGLNDDGTIDLSRLLGQQNVEAEGYCCAGYDIGKNGNVAINLPAGITEELAPGSHKMVFVNREAGTGTPWQPVFGPNSYVEFIISDDGQPTDTIIHPLPQLTASTQSMTIDGLMQRGLCQNVTVTIQNNSDDDFIGTVYCMAYYVVNNTLVSLDKISQTGIMIESHGTADITSPISFSYAGSYVFVYTTNGEILTGRKLADIRQADGYIAHKSILVEDLAFYCRGAKYREEPDEEGNPACYLDLNLVNDAPMGYKTVVLAELFMLDDNGEWNPIVFPEMPLLYSWLILDSGQRTDLSIRLPRALEPGEYYVDLKIADDFISRSPSDYFVFTTVSLKVESPTGIADIDGQPSATADRQAPIYDLSGRRLHAIPKGIYIRNGKKLTRNRPQ